MLQPVTPGSQYEHEPTGPGQLDDELAQSSWLMADVEVDLVFDVDASVMWETAIRRLGADPSMLQSSPGIH